MSSIYDIKLCIFCNESSLPAIHNLQHTRQAMQFIVIFRAQTKMPDIHAKKKKKNTTRAICEVHPALI